ncbi:uncharacterized protein [Narcine bancroftii]|uniref:uncharacterized protein isoform X2 n=1 Tax=Narcine bancroftii TaxID=1343680 RepID=UPI0038311218
MFLPARLSATLLLFTAILIHSEEAAPVMKLLPFEDEYITEIAAIDYPEERIEAFTDGGMVEYLRYKRAEPSPSPTFWPIKEIITTSIAPGIEDEEVIEVIRDKRKAGQTRAKIWPIQQLGSSKPAPPYLKEYITSKPHEAGKPYFQEDYVTIISYPVIYDSGFFVRPKRAAATGFFQQCLAKLLGVGVSVAVVAVLLYYFWYRRLKRAREQQTDEGSEYDERQPYSKRRSWHKGHQSDDLANNYTYQASPG